MATPAPRLVAETYGGVIEYALELRAALCAANADKTAIRAWATGAKYSPTPCP